MIPIDLTASAEDRSRFFWWLAAWFMNPPDQAMLSTLPATLQADLPESVMDDAWQALVSATSELGKISIDELGSEYTRLFRGVHEDQGLPPPFESVWREDRLIGESTVQVIDAYAKAGFAEIAPEVGPQDHIAAELRFIALLALREADAWQAGDETAAHRRILQQRDFLERHLSVWAPQWANAIVRQARIPLFAALASLLKAGLDQAALEVARLADESA